MESNSEVIRCDASIGHFVIALGIKADGICIAGSSLQLTEHACNGRTVQAAAQKRSGFTRDWLAAVHGPF